VKKFALPEDLRFNTEKIANPSAFAQERNAASWLYLCGAEFASMEGGMAYAQVEQAVDRAANVVSDPPRTMTVDLARQHVAALDSLPRPTIVTCRSGPRASAVAYMYSGLRTGAEPDEVIAEAERQGAPFATSDMLKSWVRESILALRRERG
jgi:hypothetical protein